MGGLRFPRRETSSLAANLGLCKLQTGFDILSGQAWVGLEQALQIKILRQSFEHKLKGFPSCHLACLWLVLCSRYGRKRIAAG
jgi:hypothetical protein